MFAKIIRSAVGLTLAISFMAVFVFNRDAVFLGITGRLIRIGLAVMLFALGITSVYCHWKGFWVIITSSVIAIAVLVSNIVPEQSLFVRVVGLSAVAVVGLWLAVAIARGWDPFRVPMT